MITFYFQAKEIGGVQVLIFNLIKELYSRNITSKLIYFKDSWITNELAKNNVNIEFYDIEALEFNALSSVIKNDDILFTTLILDEYYFLKKTNPTVLFWNVFPTSLKIDKSKFDFIRKIFRKGLINKMIQKKGLVFMDYSGVNFVRKEFGISINPGIIQIPIKASETNLYLSEKKLQPLSVINITYLGRAVRWKVNPVIKMVKDLTGWEINHSKVVLHIITDEIEEFKNLLNTSSDNFEIKYYSEITGDNLREFLLKNSDLHFAMGTSVLEGSILGIPSVLLDAAYTSYPDEYKYRWIFENENFSLGELLDDTTHVNTGHSMTEILSNYTDAGSLELSNISSRCFEYTKKNHDLKIISDLFYDACIKSELRINDILCNDVFYLNKIFTKRLLRSYLMKSKRNPLVSE